MNPRPHVGGIEKTMSKPLTLFPNETGHHETIVKGLRTYGVGRDVPTSHQDSALALADKIEKARREGQVITLSTEDRALAHRAVKYDRDGCLFLAQFNKNHRDTLMVDYYNGAVKAINKTLQVL